MYKAVSSSTPLTALIIIILFKTLAILEHGKVLSYYCFDLHSSSDYDIKLIVCVVCLCIILDVLNTYF